MDFCVLACDGIFDVFSTQEIIKFCWQKIEEWQEFNIHTLSCKLTNAILVESMRRRSLDNVTVIFIGFPGLENFLVKKRSALNSRRE